MLSVRERNAVLPYLFGTEVDYLIQLGKDLPEYSKVVMLGVGPAMMLLALFEERETPIHVWAYDIADVASADAHLAETGKSHWAALTYSDSVTAAQEWEDNAVDVLLIDACHTFECVDRDIQAWWPKVKAGGLLFFHDYVPQPHDNYINGVRAAIEKHRMDDWLEIARPGISIVFRKTR